MIASDRRRVAAASLFTVVALPALWVLSRESAATSTAPAAACDGCEVPSAGTAPPTTAYVPQQPQFVGGDEVPVGPAVVDVAMPTGPGLNEALMKASFSRYAGTTGRPCTTLLAPDGAMLTVVNVDNGQSTTCTNTYGMAVPAGANLVLHTDVFAEIGDLADSPLPVRVNW
ncbi:MAG: hypothetical protein Q7V88_14840 [Actinomycetota bacterium]|nr:hypothetical protein [Actinomycetota bacterium]